VFLLRKLASSSTSSSLSSTPLMSKLVAFCIVPLRSIPANSDNSSSRRTSPLMSKLVALSDELRIFVPDSGTAFASLVCCWTLATVKLSPILALLALTSSAASACAFTTCSIAEDIFARQSSTATTSGPGAGLAALPFRGEAAAKVAEGATGAGVAEDIKAAISLFLSR